MMRGADMTKILSCIILVLAFCGFVSAPACAGPDIEAVLRSFVEGKRPLHDIEKITYETGNEAFMGRTALRISGDGKITLAHSHRGQEKTFEGKLSEDGLKTLLKVMLEDRFWTASPATEPMARDAAEIEIGISTREKDLDYTITVLAVEALYSKELQTLVWAFRALINEVSNGEVKS
jgi:hypothetical protein